MDNRKHNYLLKLFKILSNSNRLSILELIATKESSVGQIAEKLNMDQSLISQHLSKMRENDIVKARQEGLYMYYSLKDENITTLLKL